jgi:hypothetical protein
MPFTLKHCKNGERSYPQDNKASKEHLRPRTTLRGWKTFAILPRQAKNTACTGSVVLWTRMLRPYELRDMLDLTWNSRDFLSLALNVVRAIPQPSRPSLQGPENHSSRFSRRPRCRMWIERRNWPLKRSPVIRRPAAKRALLFFGILPMGSRYIVMHWLKEHTLKPRCRSRD